MNLSKVNLILVVLLAASVLFLFLNFVKLQQSLSFNDKRIDSLEQRPLQTIIQTSPLPEAGESGRVAAQTPLSPAPVFTPLPSAMVKASPTPVAVAAKAQITYLPIYGGGAQTTNTNWVDVEGSDFQLKAGDYGSNAYFTWDAIAFLIGGSGQARLRLFDTTNNVAVNGSEISVTAAKPTLVSSGRLTFFSGNNTYRVQLASLTTSTAEFDFGRVKVMY